MERKEKNKHKNHNKYFVSHPNPKIKGMYTVTPADLK